MFSGIHNMLFPKKERSVFWNIQNLHKYKFIYVYTSIHFFCGLFAESDSVQTIAYSVDCSWMNKKWNSGEKKWPAIWVSNMGMKRKQF